MRRITPSTKSPHVICSLCAPQHVRAWSHNFSETSHNVAENCLKGHTASSTYLIPASVFLWPRHVFHHLFVRYSGAFVPVRVRRQQRKPPLDSGKARTVHKLLEKLVYDIFLDSQGAACLFNFCQKTDKEDRVFSVQFQLLHLDGDLLAYLFCFGRHVVITSPRFMS